MNRKLLLVLLLVGLGLLGVRIALSPGEAPQLPGREIVFENPVTPTPLTALKEPLTGLQASLDEVSQAALQARWAKALRSFQQLQQQWSGLGRQGADYLAMERDITALLQALEQGVLTHNKQAVLEAAGELTKLLGTLGT